MNARLNARFAAFAIALSFACLPTLLLGAGTESLPATPQKPADPDYVAGKAAVEAKNWTTAVDAFERVVQREPDNADAQNLLGYASRNTGNLDAAFKHYNEALRVDPKHRGAHEYIGETYLLAGNPEKAKEHLAALDRLCWFSCEEYRDLKRAIEAYDKRAAR
jgi:Flp pilus assembly protein TadD